MCDRQIVAYVTVPLERGSAYTRFARESTYCVGSGPVKKVKDLSEKPPINAGFGAELILDSLKKVGCVVGIFNDPYEGIGARRSVAGFVSGSIRIPPQMVRVLRQ